MEQREKVDNALKKQQWPSRGQQHELWKIKNPLACMLQAGHGDMLPLLQLLFV